MDTPKPKETEGVPWADHNETESSPPDTRREEYGDEPGRIPDEKSADSGADIPERETGEDRARIDRGS